MKHWFVLLTTAAAFTAFAPAASNAQVAVEEVPGVGVRIGEPPPPRRDRVMRIRENVRSLLPVAHTLGITIMAGTDTSGSIADEVKWLARCLKSSHARANGRSQTSQTEND